VVESIDTFGKRYINICKFLQKLVKIYKSLQEDFEISGKFGLKDFEDKAGKVSKTSCRSLEKVLYLNTNLFDIVKTLVRFRIICIAGNPDVNWGCRIFM